jgi:AcrR family transcriptional regulator
MRKIAEKIEYAPSTIYLYFEDKDEICTAIGSEAFEILIKGLEEIEQQNLPALESTRAGMRWYVDFGLANPHQYRLVFGQPSPDKVEQDSALNELGVKAMGYLARCIARCRAEGVFGPGDDMVDSIAAWAHLHGLTMVLINDYGKCSLPWPPKDDLIHHGIDLIVRGLLQQATV